MSWLSSVRGGGGWGGVEWDPRQTLPGIHGGRQDHATNAGLEIKPPVLVCFLHVTGVCYPGSLHLLRHSFCCLSA